MMVYWSVIKSWSAVTANVVELQIVTEDGMSDACGSLGRSIEVLQVACTCVSGAARRSGRPLRPFHPFHCLCSVLRTVFKLDLVE